MFARRLMWSSSPTRRASRSRASRSGKVMMPSKSKPLCSFRSMSAPYAGAAEAAPTGRVVLVFSEVPAAGDARLNGAPPLEGKRLLDGVLLLTGELVPSRAIGHVRVER